jgi:hypothetical protein
MIFLGVAVVSLLFVHHFLWTMTPGFQGPSFQGLNTDCFEILLVEVEF